MSFDRHIPVADVPAQGETLDELYDSMRLDWLATNGICRSQARHYGMVVYPSLKSATPTGAGQIYRTDTVGSARLYVHIPFCSGVCTFCHFQLASIRNADAYVEALCKEAELIRAASPSLLFHGIFVGGGTPSNLSRSQWGRLLTHLFSVFDIDTNAFNTAEVHPEFIRDPSVEETLGLLQSLGINRISIGAQAFEQHMLDSIKRRHTVDEIYELIDSSRKLNFRYVDIDIMYGLPGQSLADWEHTLTCASNANIDSISIFHLIVRPGSSISNDDASSLPDPRLSTLMHICARQQLLGSGFVETLTDHFHRPYPARETISPSAAVLYPQLAVVPLGISGWGYLNHHYYWNHFQLHDYLASINAGHIPVCEAVFLDSEETLRRDVMFGLKYGECNLQKLQQFHTLNIRATVLYAIEFASELGLIEDLGHVIRLTYTGRLFLEETCCLFFSDKSAREQVAALGQDSYKERFNYLVIPDTGAPQKVCCLLAHPREGSLTKSLCDAFVESASAFGHDCSVIDLYCQQYDPVVPAGEIAAESRDPIVLDHQQQVDAADVLAIFYPIWWYGMPAILKGWIDRTFTNGFAFRFDQQKRYAGLLSGKKVVVFALAGDTHENFEIDWGASYVAAQITKVFATAGITDICIRILTNSHHRTAEQLAAFDSEVRFIARHLPFPVLYSSKARIR